VVNCNSYFSYSELLNGVSHTRSQGS
jgi:hypothetical protein